MAAQQRNINEFSLLLHYTTGYSRVSFQSDRKRKRGILRQKCIEAFPRLAYSTEFSSTDYLTSSHVTNYHTLSSTSLLGKMFVVECTW